MTEKKKDNILVVVAFMLKGKSQAKGSVIAKSDFDNKGDWSNLCNMKPVRAEETSEAVRKAPTSKPKATGGMPGASN